MLERHPALAAARARREAARREVDLAGTDGSPFLRLEAFSNRFYASTVHGGRLSVVFPVLDWGRVHSAVEQARARVRQRESELEALQLGIRREVQAAFRELQAARREAALLEEEVVTRAARVEEMTWTGYRAGMLTYLDVLEAQRTLRQVRLQLVEARTRRLEARARLERALGGTLPRRKP